MANRPNSPLRGGYDYSIVTPELLTEDVHRASFGDTTQGGLVNEAAKGLRRYMDNRATGSLAEQALDAELAGNTSGYDRLMAERALRLNTSAPDAPRVGGFTDIGSVGDAVDWAGSTFGEGVPSLVPTIAGAAAGRFGLGRLIGNAPAAALGGAVPAYGDIRRGEIEAQYDDPALAATSAEDRSRTATLTAALGTGLEVLLPTRIVGGMGRGVGGIARRRLDDVATEALAEGGQDVISQVGQMGLDPSREFSTSSVIDSAAAGALVGGAVGTLGRPTQDTIDDIRGAASGAAGAAARVAGAMPSFGANPPIDLNASAAEAADAADPSAPDDGTGGGVGGLFDTLNERFGPGMREQAHKAKDFVSDIINRMDEAAKTAQTPDEFLRQVFSGSTEDAAAADLLPDTEDPSVLNSADPAAAMQQRDAERQQRAARFAEELLSDPATPDAIKERVASFGGDFTNPEAQAFVARTLVAQRAGEKLANAVNDLIDLTKDFGGKARDMLDKSMAAATDRITKKSLQGISLVDAKPLVDILAQRLGPAKAAEAPKLAQQLLALSVRMSPDTRITPEIDARLRSLSDAIDDDVLDAVTEASGSEGLRQALVRIREIPSARTDVANSSGSSFLESMLVRPLPDGQRKQLAEAVDAAGLQLKDLNPTRRDQLLTGLAAAFGSKENAQTVVEYYGNLRREAMQREADGSSDPDDMSDQSGEDVTYEAPRPTGDAYEGTDGVAEYGTLPDRDAPEQDTYYADPKSMRPFYEGREGRLSTEGGTRRRVRDIEAFMDRMRGRGVELRSQRYGDFLKERNEDSAAAVKRIRKDLEKRIAEAAPRKGEAAEYAEGRTKNRQYLEEQLLALNLIEGADGPEAAANLFSVARAVGERNELGITDAQLAEADTLLRRTVDPKKPPRGMTQWRAEKHNRDIEKTKITFNRRDGAQPLVLSAESLWKAYAKGQPAGRPVRQLFADAVSAVLNRPDVEDLAGELDGVLIDRASGTYATPHVDPDVAAMKEELAPEYEARVAEAERRVAQVLGRIETAMGEAEISAELVERVEAASDRLQRAADAARMDATELRGKAKALKWVDGAPAPEAIELRARAAWERDISRVYADGASSVREMAFDASTELDRRDTDGDSMYQSAPIEPLDVERRRLSKRVADLYTKIQEGRGTEKDVRAADAARQRIAELDAQEAAIAGGEKPYERGTGREGRAKARNYDEFTGAALHPDDKPVAAKPKGLGKRLDAVLLANPELLEVLDARGEPKDKGMTESRMRENLFKAYAAIKTPALKARLEGLRAKYQEAKNASNVGTPAAREAAKQEAAALKEIGQMVRWIVERREGVRTDDAPAAKREDAMAREKKGAPSRVILPQISRYAAKDQAKSDRANKFIGRGAPGSSTAAYAEAWGDRANVGEYSPEDTVFISVNGNRPGALSPPWPEIKKAMSAGATLITDVPADRNRSFNTGERAVADFLDGNGYFEESPGTWVRGYDIDNATGQKRFAPLGEGVAEKQPRAPKTSQGKVVKKSFVGAKADPEGASDAEKLLGIGAPADVVWRDLGWFRGPDGKLRKEIRSPVLRRRVRDFATAVANGSRSKVMVRDLLAGIDAFKPYLDKLGDLPVDPNDGMVELVGAVGAYNGEDGFSDRGIGISRLNAELAARTEAVPDGKGIELLRELVASMTPPELANTGLNFADPTDLIAALEARYPMPDVNERVADMLAGTILHELQHAFQHVEGFENGGNTTTAVIAKYGDVDEYIAAVRDGDEDTVESITEQAYAQLRAEVGPDGDMEAAAQKLYESIVGEVEANDVAARMNLSDEEAASVKPALMDAKRKFVRSVLLAEALSTFRSRLNSSKMGAKRGRPGKDWGDKDAVKAEILRLRGKDVKVKVEKLVKQLGGSGQYTYDPATGERLIEVAVNASSTVGTARHEAMHDLFRFLSENEATRSIARDLRDATSAPHVIRQLRDLLKNDKAALEQLNDPEERAAYAYQFWAEGLLRVGPTGTGIFNTIRQFLKDLFGIVTSGQRGEDLLRAFHDGKFADPSIVQEVLQDLNDSSGDRVANKLNRAAPALTRALNSLLSAAPERLRRFENDYLNELADKFQPESGTGFSQNRPQQEAMWTNRLAGILRGTTAVERREAVDQLQAMKPTSKLAKELAKFNEDIYEYMRDAGVQSWDSTTKKFVPLRKVQGYFTRSWDPDAIAGNRAEFEALLRKEGRVSAADAAMIAGNLARGTEARPGPKESPVDLGFMPYAPHTSERVLTFINPGNADKFAKFQRKDLADIMMSYVRGSTHRAEYAREFGNNGEKIVDLVAKSGVKDPKELEEISNAVQALEGSLDPGNWSVQTKEAMSAVLTLQNVTLLPLAIVSQMIDPIVLAARTGDIKDAGTAYVTALKRLKNTITKSKNKVPGEELAEILGVVSEDSTLQAMAMAYGTTRMSKRMENINRVFFKYNGMQGWNNSMRIAATAAGERYLLAHKGDAKALAELGLEPKDIKSTGGKLDVSSPKVQQAMFQFVDQAVLRPSAANRPVWMSDPRFLLVAHLKQFTFAMHNVVLKRANRELQNDNPKPWGVLMLAMPVILAADMAKFALTGRVPAGWEFKDYVLHAVERSGILGLGDFGVQAMDRVDSGKMPGEGLLGPTFENLMKILRWIGGDPRTDFGDVVDRTVPGARFI